MPSQLRVFDLSHKCAVARLFVGEKSARWINRRGGQAQRLEFIENFCTAKLSVRASTSRSMIWRKGNRFCTFSNFGSSSSGGRPSQSTKRFQ